MVEKKEVKVLGLYTLRTLVILLGIWILKLIIVALPFFKEIYIPDFPFTVVQIVDILITAIIAFVIVNYGIGLSKYWPVEFPKAPELGIVLTMIVFLIGLTSTYDTLKDILTTLDAGSEAVLILQIVFLVTAVLLLLRAAIVAYQSLPKWLSNLHDSFTNPPKSGK